MTDLELVNKFCEECRDFINPLLLRDIESRGLYNIINYLPKDINEAKIVAYARMAGKGMVFGNDEIDKVSGEIQMLNKLVLNFKEMNQADVHQTIPVMEEMLERAKYIRDYFK